MRARCKRLAGPPDAHSAEPRCGSGKAGLARAGDEGEERVEFLAGLEGITAQVINRADRARTRGLLDEFLKRHQALITRVQPMPGTRSRRDHLPLLRRCARAGHVALLVRRRGWGVPLLKRRVSVIFTLLACMGWIGLVAEGSLPAISICQQPARRSGSGLVTCWTSSTPCPAQADRPCSDSGRSAILHLPGDAPKVPLRGRHGPRFHIRNMYMNWWSYGDSNPGPLACHSWRNRLETSK